MEDALPVAHHLASPLTPACPPTTPVPALLRVCPQTPDSLRASRPPPPCSIVSGNGLTGSLPPSWGQAPAFPALQELNMDDLPGVSGSLPSAWGSNGGFAELKLLSTVKAGLRGTLPREWGAPGRFPKLNQL